MRIADHWNATCIIAKSQANPLKAAAEIVENSIDASARQIVFIRGKNKGEFYLKISDDGDGIPILRGSTALGAGSPQFKSGRPDHFTLAYQ